MPLSRAVLAVISLFYAVGYWSAWFNATIYLTDQQMMPLQNVLIQLVQKHTEAPTGLQQAVRTGELSRSGCRWPSWCSPSSRSPSPPLRPATLQEGHAHGGGEGVTIAHDGRLLYGGDYNPEQWPEELWADDVRLMKEAGVTSVTLGVFSWAKLEPTPGAREFGWLDRLMDLMHSHGIGVVLATPTASPPPWLGRLHPKTLPRDENGQTVWWGSRQQFAHSSSAYRRHAAAITEDLAIRYGHHPALRMWHINNEYCTFDYGDEAARAFRDWLRTKYGTLDALNDAWGTAFEPARGDVG